MSIYLIRHGHYIPGNDERLTEKGIEQVVRLCNRFLDEGTYINSIYSSTHPRAMESARVCSERLGIGGFVPLYQLDEEQNRESDADVADRMRNLLESLSCTETTGVFSHYFSIMRFMSSLDRSKRIGQPHAGVILLDNSGGGLRLVDYDPKSHLKGIETY